MIPVLPCIDDNYVLASILYKDAGVIILNKPTGIAVHKTPKGDPCLEAHFQVLKFGLPRAPALAHRLDKMTSGCLVLGRDRGSLARLGKLFESGRISKRYIAIVSGIPPLTKGTVSKSIKRIDLGRGKWEFTCADDGQEAHSDYEVLARSETHSLLSLWPRTGRTHQLRLHCQALGCPIVGDMFYGGGDGALMLHAYQVMIPSGSGQPRIECSAPFPEHMLTFMTQQGFALPPAIF